MTKLERAVNSLDNDTLAELGAMSQQGLKDRIVGASETMRQALEELENNANYQKVKEDKAALEAGKKEVNKRQKAIIEVALSHLTGQATNEAK